MTNIYYIAHKIYYLSNSDQKRKDLLQKLYIEKFETSESYILSECAMHETKSPGFFSTPDIQN